MMVDMDNVQEESAEMTDLGFQRVSNLPYKTAIIGDDGAMWFTLRDDEETEGRYCTFITTVNAPDVLQVYPHSESVDYEAILDHMRLAKAQGIDGVTEVFNLISLLGMPFEMRTGVYTPELIENDDLVDWSHARYQLTVLGEDVIGLVDTYAENPRVREAGQWVETSKGDIRVKGDESTSAHYFKSNLFLPKYDELQAQKKKITLEHFEKGIIK